VSPWNAVIGIFADVLANPDADHPNKDGALYGVPMFLKDLGSGLIGRTQDSGSGLTRGTVLKPPPSEDIDSGTMLVAATTPEPPDDPPEVRSRFQGLRVTVTSPSYSVRVSKVRPNSGVLERPRGTSPA
jgi:amidase